MKGQELALSNSQELKILRLNLSLIQPQHIMVAQIVADIQVLTDLFQKRQTSLLMVVGNIPCQVEVNNFFLFEGLDEGVDFGLPKLIAVDMQVAHNSQFFHDFIIQERIQKNSPRDCFLRSVDSAEFELLHEEGGDKEDRGSQREEDRNHTGVITQEEADNQQGHGDRETGRVGWIGLNQNLVSILHLDIAGTEGLNGQDGCIAFWKRNIQELGRRIGHFCHFNTIDKDF